MSQAIPIAQYHAYQVRDAPTRWFHWINALAVIGLIIVGVLLLNDGALGLSAGGKVLLKQIPVALGYAMAANLIWRFAWAFLGNRYARWRAMLPYGSGYWGALRSYAAAFLTGEPQQYLAHNPVARIAIALLLLLLLSQTATGLILAGTDLFWPPFGGWFAGWVSAAGVDPAAVSPLALDTFNQGAYKAMRAFRSPTATIHLYTFYALACVILTQVAAVIVTEIHEGGGIMSAMFTGQKSLNRPPQDLGSLECVQFIVKRTSLSASVGCARPYLAQTTVLSRRPAWSSASPRLLLQPMKSSLQVSPVSWPAQPPWPRANMFP
jgi:Ni/Fe-hydrogenase 1 B-type cytochrome subunit